jgi:hypothetical protein
MIRLRGGAVLAEVLESGKPQMRESEQKCTIIIPINCFFKAAYLVYAIIERENCSTALFEDLVRFCNLLAIAVRDERVLTQLEEIDEHLFEQHSAELAAAVQADNED